MSPETKIQDQIYLLRLLGRLDSKLEVSLTGKSKWIPLFDVIKNPPKILISARSIIKNELVFEIDNDDWTIVRDGSLRILNVLDKWGAEDCYYLSYTGNRSIHIKVYFDPGSIILENKTREILEHIDVSNVSEDTDENKKDEVRKYLIRTATKFYIMRQVALATDTNIDMNLASKHLIRLEGSINEKSGKYCTYIESIPENKPENYPVVVPDKLPPKLWDLSFMKDELNAFLQVHFRKSTAPITYGLGKPIGDPERFIDILRPAYAKGYRHWIVSSLSGHFKRHQVQFDRANSIIKELAKGDEELSSRLYTVKEIYRANESKRIPGLPKLIEIVNAEVKDGKLSSNLANSIILKLKGGDRNGNN
jgi:hypothetical protein